MKQLLTAWSVLVALAYAAAGAPPRYAFELGDWFVYEMRTEQSRLGQDQATRRYVDQVQIWCLDHRLGAKLLLVDRIRVEGGEVGPCEGILLWVDPRGGRELWPECEHLLPDFDQTLNLLPLFPQVLSNPSDWRSAADNFGRIWAGQTEAAEGDDVLLNLRLLEPEHLQTLIPGESSGRIRFDTSLNVVRELHWTTEDPTTATKAIQQARLVRRSRFDATWLQDRLTERNRYRQVLRSDHAMRIASTQPFDVPAALNRIPRLWDEYARLLQQAEKSPFRLLCNGARQRLGTNPSKLRYQVLPLATWVGRPARDWTLPQPDGTELRSEAVRSGPSFEWYYSGANRTSLYAADAVRRLAEAFPPEITVVAYNVDQDPVRAAATARQLPGPWTHVLAPPLLEMETLHVLPAFRVLDEDGVVRAAALGWHENLESLTEPVLGDWLRARRLSETLGNLNP
jgi:hypothetical protein